MDVLMLVSALVLAIGGENSQLSNDTLTVTLAAEQAPCRVPNPLFPLPQTPTESTDFVHETPPNLEPPTGTSEPDFDGPNVSIFVSLVKPNPPQNDSRQNPLFVPLSHNPMED